MREMSLTSTLLWKVYKSPEDTNSRMGYALLGVPLAEELDLLAELGDVLGESLNRGHFEGRES